MLPAHRRIRRPEEFRSVLRGGTRASTRTMVVHLGPLPLTERRIQTPGLPAEPVGPPARAGFVVGRSVGGSVTRNRVTRRLRHLVAARLADLPPGTGLVVRALPPAAGATTDDLAGDLASGVQRCLRSWVGRSAVTAPGMSR